MSSELISIPAGDFLVGSDHHYPEEAPQHRARVAAFKVERSPVTNRNFARFVADTGYVTVAEQALDAREYPQLSPEQRAAGSLIFEKTVGPVDLRNWRLWWKWQTGADWRHPFGPDTNIDGLDDHPVVQVSHADASAYARWAGRRLPTEAEWERAARGGADGLDFVWGAELNPQGQLLANTWQGSFPYQNTGALGWHGTSSVGSFPANGFGLHDMIGNVWEWTSSVFTANHRTATAATDLGVEPSSSVSDSGTADAGGCSCGPTDSRQAGGQQKSTPKMVAAHSSLPDPSVQRVTKGGSHLCAPEYCQRYRPAARSPQTEDSATTHLGFRCATDA